MRSRTLTALCLATAGLVMVPGAALADHTNPREKLAQTQDPGTTQLLTFGEGEWTFIRNFPANPGTDIKFFRRHGRLFAAAGTLGQQDEQHVGQRIIKLTNRNGRVRPKWWADHGSANCPAEDPSATTSLQHDQTLTPKRAPRIMIDTTDAAGRCHDPDGGGLELIDVSGRMFPKKGFKPREIHLTRHVGTSHTVTRDAKRPWIIYNNSSQSSGSPWVDVLDIKSCLKRGLKTLQQKRKACRPEVYRIYFKDEWTQRIDAAGERVQGTEASCHDVTSKGYRLYCANLNSTIILNVRDLTNDGEIRGDPLKCKLVNGTNTGAKVTDCSGNALGQGQAKGWRYVGHINHPGRNGSHNTNTEYTRTEGIAVSQEADPTPNNKFMFVTDERGGGLVPGGASCTEPSVNPYENGGVHVFKTTGNGIRYAKNPEGDNAVFIGNVHIDSPTFCTAHVMEQIPGEQRFTIAWYTQGTKIVDYFIDDNGRWTFRETASVIPTGPNANTWASQVFKKKMNKDGTVTYWFMANDITRGIDIFKWTGPANPRGTPPPPVEEQREGSGHSSTAALIVLGAIPAALRLRRRSPRT
jgi:hypothetical protein